MKQGVETVGLAALLAPESIHPLPGGVDGNRLTSDSYNKGKYL